MDEKVLIFDIGANIGSFTDTCLRTYKNVKVITVEPNKILYNTLVNKYFNNSSVTVLPNLVAQRSDEMIDFYISSIDVISTAEPDWVNNSRFKGKYSGNKVQIKSISLDSLIEQYGNPDLIKIDVEGYELEVIKGLSKKQKEICFEWAEEQYEKINQTCDHLKQIGYTEFGYIYEDAYLKKPENYGVWEELEIHKDIDPNRKYKWGMIWVK